MHACLEATGPYGDGLAETLADAGLVVSVVNPAIIEAYARSCLTRTKTDPTDARLMAQFCATQQPRPWVPLPPEVRALQASCAGSTRSRGCARKSATGSPLTPPAEVRDSNTHVIAVLEAEMQAVRRRIRAHVDQHPHLRQQRDLLTSIRGSATRRERCCSPKSVRWAATARPARRRPLPA